MGKDEEVNERIDVFLFLMLPLSPPSLKAAQRDVLALLKVLKGAQSGNLPLTITTQAALSLVAVSSEMH